VARDTSAACFLLVATSPRCLVTTELGLLVNRIAYASCLIKTLFSPESTAESSAEQGLSRNFQGFQIAGCGENREVPSEI
jgi:hypothetical protein